MYIRMYVPHMTMRHVRLKAAILACIEGCARATCCHLGSDHLPPTIHHAPPRVGAHFQASCNAEVTTLIVGFCGCAGRVVVSSVILPHPIGM